MLGRIGVLGVAQTSDSVGWFALQESHGGWRKVELSCFASGLRLKPNRERTDGRIGIRHHDGAN